MGDDNIVAPGRVDDGHIVKLVGNTNKDTEDQIIFIPKNRKKQLFGKIRKYQDATKFFEPGISEAAKFKRRLDLREKAFPNGNELPTATLKKLADAMGLSVEQLTD